MNVCRICLCDESETFDRFLVDIFQHNNKKYKFSVPAAFQAICGIELKESKIHPNRVCLECRSRLEEAFNLRILALRSHETLATISSNQKEAQDIVLNHEPAPEVPDDPVDVQWMEIVPLMNNYDDVESEVLSFSEEKHVENDEDQQEEASADRMWICCGCEFTCVDEWTLMEHSKQVHFPGVPVDPPKNKTLCRICYALFLSEKVLGVHWSGKTGGRVVRICPRCEERFLSKKRYEKHKCSKQNNVLFRCCGCDFQTADENKFRWHANCHRNAERRTRNDELVKSHPIFCSVCAGRFKTKNELTIHRAGHARLDLTKKPKVIVGNSVDLMLTCCGCLKVYKTAEEVKKHQEQDHVAQLKAVSSNVYKCGDCQKRFVHKSQLKKHTNTRRQFKCSKCPALRHSVHNMLQHLATHDGPKSYWCCGCRLHRKRFDTLEELERHSQEIHAKQPRFYHKVDNIEEQRPFECKTCYRRYTDERNLRAHMVATYQEETFVCDTCGKLFSQFQAFDTHLAIHKETFDYSCSICSKKFKHEKQARGCQLRHIKEANEEYICKICGGKFANSSNLNSHLISHSNVTRFSCSICGMRFKRKTSLRSHMIYHGNDRNFPCPYCPGRFYTSATLNKHLTKHTGIYPYQCEFPGCGKNIQARLKYIQHFEAHMEDSARVFYCHMCEQRYSRDHFLSNHLKYVHRIEPQDKDWISKFNRQSQPGVRPRGRPSAQAAVHQKVEGGEGNEELIETVEYIEQDIE